MAGPDLDVKRARRALIGAVGRLVYLAPMAPSPLQPSALARSGAGSRRLAAVMAALLFDLAMTAFLWSGGEFAREDAPAAADAAIVYYTDDASALSRRLDTAILLYRNAGARRLCLVGGFRREGVATGAEVAAATVVAAGVPPSDVYFDRRSFDTGSNIDAAIDLARANGWRRLVHISDGMHLKRIREQVAEREAASIISGYAPAPYAGLADIWVRAHYEMATRLLRLALSDEGLRELARRARVRGGAAG